LSAAEHYVGRSGIFRAAGAAYTAFDGHRMRSAPSKTWRYPLMNPLIRTIALAAAFAAPLAAQAQTSQPLTRAEVHAEVVALRKAGFQPSDWFYPASIQAAEAKIARQQGAPRAAGADYGNRGAYSPGQ